jgi:hypothetical protein
MAALRPWRPFAFIGLLWIALTVGCQRGPSALYITAPFNEETRLARVDATWQVAEGGQAKYSVQVENSLADRLYVRLEGFSLTGAHGKALAQAVGQGACVLARGQKATVIAGDLLLPAEAAGHIDGFDVKRFGVPLSERGRAIYREFLLQSQKFSGAEVDAELAGYQNAPPCP